jgi:DNA repair and recombination protein RAD52
MFSDHQKAALAAPLHREHVKQRSQSGRQLSYIEGWHAIAEANRIFGFDGWTRETLDIRCVAERERKIGQSGRDGFGVSYIAKVRVTVGGLVREGIGSGHGIDADLGLAHESAIKEAETDAMKRALMTFGNPFGLALYDKTQENVSDEPDRSEAMAYVARSKTELLQVETTEELRNWWKAEGKNRLLYGFVKEDPLYQELYNAMCQRGRELSPEQKGAAE